MMTDLPAVGHNTVAPIVERLELDYGALLNAVTEELNAAEALPEVVENSTDMAEVGAMIIRLRDLAARAESHRRSEKEPWLRGGNAVHVFFTKRLIESLDLMRRILSRRLDVFKQRQLADERVKREVAATAARRQHEEAQRTLRESEDAVGRARSLESKLQREQEAASARVESDAANARAEDAALQTKTKAGRMVGEHFEGTRSGQVTMRKHEVVYINDVRKLDLELLRPFLKEEHLLMALRAWARATGFAREMPGATVSVREVAIVR
jgi:hypothetical protein